MKEGGKINIWEEMEEDMGKKYGHTEKGVLSPFRLFSQSVAFGGFQKPQVKDPDFLLSGFMIR